MRSIRQDVLYALSRLRYSTGFALAAVIVLLPARRAALVNPILALRSE